MSVLNIATTHIRDAEKMRAYIAAAAPLLQDFGAEVVLRGRYCKTLLGPAQEKHIVGVFRFPDLETATRFYDSDAYRKLIPLRDAAGVMRFDVYDEG